MRQSDFDAEHNAHEFLKKQYVALKATLERMAMPRDGQRFSAAGPSMNMGPSSMNAGPYSMNMGPSSLNAGPSSMNMDPSNMNIGPSSMNAGASSAKAGPSLTKARPKVGVLFSTRICRNLIAYYSF